MVGEKAGIKKIYLILASSTSYHISFPGSTLIHVGAYGPFIR